MENKINSKEQLLYFGIWTSANLFILYRLFEAQNEILENNYILRLHLNLKPGWSILSRLQDVSDLEWAAWKFLVCILWPYLIVFIIISEVIRKKMKSLLKIWYILSTSVFIVVNFNIVHLMLLIIQPIIYTLVIYFNGNCLAVLSISLLIFTNPTILHLVYMYLYSLILENPYIEHYPLLLSICFGWSNLRCISFSIDYINGKNRASNQNETIKDIFLNMTSYVLYLPLLYFGPLVTYEDFNRNISATLDGNNERIKTFITGMMKYIFYATFLDLSLHFIYFLEMIKYTSAFENFPTMALCGAGVWMGVRFNLKYVCMYGVGGAWAVLDGVETPPIPVCVLTIHKYSKMWRMFDVGYYKFVIRYIYKPTEQKIRQKYLLHPSICKLAGLFSSFLFAFVWHGSTKHALVWCTLNLLGLLIENLGNIVISTPKYKQFKSNVLKTNAMERRFVSLVYAPFYAISCISNFYFFAGIDVGNMFIWYFFQPNSIWNTIIVWLVWYCCCQVSMALEDYPPNKYSKAKRYVYHYDEQF